MQLLSFAVDPVTPDCGIVACFETLVIAGAKLTKILRDLCREQGHERIVSLLEGGYSERGITEGVRYHIEALEVKGDGKKEQGEE